ncbi:MAG: glycosyltransferase family 2 protein [Thermoanaerobaculia bacterium]|nr:glycosyltransferase family 2 protein [Thermoanaerobaculia bacterium]
MPKPESVVVAVLSWNGLEHLKHCLPALAEQKDPGTPWQVVVLDNGSWDGSDAWVEEHFPDVRLLRSDVNLGFCGGNHKIVLETDADAVVFLNNDTRPEPDWLAALVEAYGSAGDDVAAVSGAIVDWEGGHLDFARGVVTFDGHAFQKGFGRPLTEAALPTGGTELAFACGGNMMIRRETYLEVGGFDRDYFAYLEDVDLGWRLWAAGHRIVFAPDAVVRHRSMATSAMLGHANRGFLFERNAYLTAYKNLDDELWPHLSPLVWMTLVHRAQTLMVQNNPGGHLLTLDPYAGLIANTASSEASDGARIDREEPRAGQSALHDLGRVPETTLVEKWRGYGPREFFRRGVRKAVRKALPWLFEETPVTRLVDARTYAHLRAVTWILGHLDAHSAKRRQTQARRLRSDREILERFPLHVIPTYPGDRSLFQSATFRDQLPTDLTRFLFRELDEIINVKPS